VRVPKTDNKIRGGDEMKALTQAAAAVTLVTLILAACSQKQEAVAPAAESAAPTTESTVSDTGTTTTFPAEPPAEPAPPPAQ
jgi:ABC-type glycerol-3-phosphate transport system substrate-binding protein